MKAVRMHGYGGVEQLFYEDAEEPLKPGETLLIIGVGGGVAARLLSFMSRSRIKPIVDRVFPLKEAAAAQRYLEEAKQFGKVVLRISD